MIILGIDPGIAIVGYGVIEYKGNNFRVIDYGAITTPAHTDLTTRLEMVYKGVDTIIKSYDIDEVGIEELFFNKNVKTAITVAQARGLLFLRVRTTMFRFTSILHLRSSREFADMVGQIKSGCRRVLLHF